MTRFGTVTPAVQLRFDAVGSVVPVGNTVRKPAAVVAVTGALRTTAVTPLAGMPPVPVTWTLRVAPGTSFNPALGWPLPARVSVMRAGTNGTNCPAEPPVLVGAK